MAETLPTPGSDAALDRGCTCPVLDNYHGQGIPSAEYGRPVFWVSGDCPLHCPEDWDE